MSEHKLDCCVVRDLLPAYVEDLTEAETATQVAEHLERCPACRRVEENMRAGLTMAKAPQPALNFLKRVRRTRLLAAALTVALALWCLWWLYDAQAYRYPNTEAGRLEAVEDYVPSPADSRVPGVREGDPLRVLGWTEEGGSLYVAYAADNADNVHGILRLERGLNGKYWPVDSSESPFPYTAGVAGQTMSGPGGEWLFFLMGDGCREIWSARVTYSAALKDSEQMHTYGAVYQIGQPDFLWQIDLRQLEEELGIPEGELERVVDVQAALLDRDGRDVTEQYKDPSVTASWGGGKGTAERFLLYVYMGIVALLAVGLVRYFLRRD